jgi:ribosomal-protein-alanine N-acetyltransferase
MKIILTTPRLILREFEVTDGDFMYELNANWEVVKYTGDVAFETREKAYEFAQNYGQVYEKWGFGRWLMLDKQREKAIGWCGLRQYEEDSEVDLGYRLFQEEWGKGYGTEAAAACLEYGFRELKMPFIIARAMKENIGSIRIMQKIGMEFWKEENCDNENGVIYKK